ncbi:MAG: preprotein translocase subunit SecG, partial [Pseudomonadales bacterium]|nr:preprotein translocase subunit SecG [Pseudomonadales bacterium]
MDPQVLETLALIVHVLASLGIIGLVLLQHGKGAEMGSGFGGGSSGTVFGSGGAGNFLTKATTYIAVA